MITKLSNIPTPVAIALVVTLLLLALASTQLIPWVMSWSYFGHDMCMDPSVSVTSDYYATHCM